MAETDLSSLEGFKKQNLTAFVIGYTGGTGNVLVEELDRLKLFKRVILIGRRQVSLAVGEEFEQKVVDFERLDDFKDVFQGCDVGFYLLGTTRGKAGKDGFIRVDRDYCLKVAEIAKEQNCKHFSLMSSAMSNANSSNLYLRIKGEVEEAIKAMNFDRLSIFRPSYLLGKRQECRCADVMEVILRPIACCCPTAMTVPMVTVARAMIVDAIAPVTGDSQHVTFDNKTIHLMAGECPT